MRRASILLLLVACFHFSFGTVYYVSTSGNDNSGDGSSGNPWRSLRNAVTRVPGGQGHTIRLSAGTFVEAGAIHVPVGINIEGAGVDQTILKAASAFHFNPGSPGFALDKFLLNLTSGSASNGNQTLKNFTLDGDGKRLHGGIYVKFRSNVTIEGIKVTGTNFCGIWIWDVKNSLLRNVTIINSSWGSASWASGALQLANLESVELTNLHIDENVGYGVKALGSGGNRITRMKFHDSRITVTPNGKWNNGSAPNISFELWEVLLTDCEIYNNYMDNHLSLVNFPTTPTGGRSVRVHHNVFDLKSRANGHGYGIEVTINDVEIDNNWFNGGSYGIANWSPTVCANWSIHHNTFYGLNSGWPGSVVRSQVSGLHNVRFFNNTVELAGTTTINVVSLHGGKSDNVQIKNNLFIDSNTSYSFWQNPLIFTENGATISGFQITHNLFQKMPVGSVGGASYSNNKTADPLITRSGARPAPYYVPKPGSPLIDAGTNVGFPYSGSAPDIGAHEVGAIVAPPNQMPTVSISAPANNSSVSVGNITISATATDSDGSVTKVEFYNGNTKLGEDTSAPFSFVWNNEQAGTYTLTARATDNKSGTATSSPITIKVNAANAMPIVSLTSPTANATFTAGSTVALSANASDSDGSVTKVEFYNGNTKLGEDTSAPFAFTWNNVQAGTYNLTARATDNQSGTATSSPIVIKVNAANAMPIVSLTSPAANATFTAGATVALSANASDSDGSVTTVEFYNGNTKLGEDTSAPFTFSWNNVQAGTYTLTARATDNQSGSVTSSPVTIKVNAVNAMPIVSLTSPAANATFTAGATVTLSANASDSDGSVTKVEFYNGNTKLGEDTSAPFSFTWTNVPAGTHSLLAKAIDNTNGITSSSQITIIVSPANNAPTVSLTAPADNATFNVNADITITATAADQNGTVAKVEFYNGTTKLGEDVTRPYSFVMRNVSEGTYALHAKAIDNDGASTSSTTRTITVELITTGASVVVTSPLNGTTFKVGDVIELAARTRTTAGSIAKVEFFANNIKVGEDFTTPYSHNWKGASAGNHTILARATDNLGEVVTSTAVSIVVAPEASEPVVKITKPSNNAVFKLGDIISIETSTSADGEIRKVEFFDGKEKLGEDLEKPYTFVWTDASEGTHTIIAKVTDDNNKTASDQIIVSVEGEPVAHAGDDIVVTLPENIVQLRGTSLAASETTTFSWKQLSGPTQALVDDLSSPTPMISELSAGEYVFELTITHNGIASKDQVRITVVEATPDNIPDASIPRFFSPNSDGINDVWEWPTSETYANAALTVFNRSGQTIYHSESYQNTWDGTVDGKVLQPGAYFYIIRLSNSTDIRGSVRIVR